MPFTSVGQQFDIDRAKRMQSHYVAECPELQPFQQYGPVHMHVGCGHVQETGWMLSLCPQPLETACCSRCFLKVFLIPDKDPKDARFFLFRLHILAQVESQA